jgi:hypothetical protein
VLLSVRPALPKSDALLLVPTGDGSGVAPAASHGRRLRCSRGAPPATAVLLPRRPHRRRLRSSRGAPTGEGGAALSATPPATRVWNPLLQRPHQLGAQQQRPRGALRRFGLIGGSPAAARRSPASRLTRQRRLGGALRRVALVGGGPAEAEPCVASRSAASRRVEPCAASHSSAAARQSPSVRHIELVGCGLVEPSVRRSPLLSSGPTETSVRRREWSPTCVAPRSPGTEDAPLW